MADQMERSRAARAIIDSTHPRDCPDRKAMEMAAFLDIFHPGLSSKAKRELVSDARYAHPDNR